MQDFLLNDMEKDTIGEILNISFGSSTTAMSNMLEKRVDITVPNVEVIGFEEFEFNSFEPAVGVEITYTEGLSGNNIMILKKSDVREIVDILLNTKTNPEEFELTELNKSAICEVMNQMMGASSTALAEVLETTVNITTPVTFEVEDKNDFKHKYFSDDEPMVVVKFHLKIEDVIESEFLIVLKIDLAKRIIESFKLDVNTDINAQNKEVKSKIQKKSFDNLDDFDSDNKTTKNNYSVFSSGQQSDKKTHGTNLDLIMTVPLQVSVEIGRTKKNVKEIIELTNGSLVVLDKLAGEPVDIFANGQYIAKGDVVVVDDSFGVRITEIIKNPELLF